MESRVVGLFSDSRLFALHANLPISANKGQKAPFLPISRYFEALFVFGSARDLAACHFP
jgi:hypothetical protein